MEKQSFVTSYLAAWNDQDPSAVADHLCTGGTYNDVQGQQELAGADLIAHLVAYFSNDQYRYEIVGDVLADNNTLAFQYDVYPLNSGAETPAWSGAEFIHMNGNTAQHINDYYRLPSAISQRGGLSESGRRYAKSGLSGDAMQQLLDALNQSMQEEQAYLDPDLSLPRLAEKLGCSVNHLSQAINAGHSMSFFDYVNQYRVQEAANMLRQKDCRFPAILDVALSVGFNSTSTFYTAFKKSTGQTPAKYRRLATD